MIAACWQHTPQEVLFRMALETMNELHFTLQVALDTHLYLNLMFDNHRGKKNNNNKKRRNEQTEEPTNKQTNN